MADPSHKSQIVGEAIADLTINGKTYIGIEMYILKNLFTDLILGKDFLRKHKQVIFHFNGNENTLHLPKSPTAETIISNQSLVVNALSTMNVEPPSVFVNMSPNLKPVTCKSRRYTTADRKFITEETTRLLKEGIIVPSNSSWRAQVLVTTNPTGKKRMVIDYSRTVNMYTGLDAYPLPRIDDMINRVSEYKYYTTLDLKSAYHQLPLKVNEQPYTAFEVDGKLYQFTRLPFGVTNGTAAFQRTIDGIIEKEELSDTFAYVDNVTICGKTIEEHNRNLKNFEQAAAKYNLTFNIDKSIYCSESITLLGYQVEHHAIKPDPSRLQALIEMTPPTNPDSLRRIVGLFAYYSKWIKNFSTKIHPLSHNTGFPLSDNAKNAFFALKNEIKDAAISTIDSDVPFVVETDASNVAIAATLNQEGRPVAFFSRTLNQTEQKHHAVEKEAYAIVEAFKTWRHFLLGRHFKVITDQRSVSFMYDSSRKTKVKNDKIARWRLELSDFKFDVVYRPGKENAGADAFSRSTACAAVFHTESKLREIHNALCHPGITRMNHFVKSRNLPYSIEDIKRLIMACPVCSELKPRFHRSSGKLINATQPFQRLNIDFKGPLPSSNQHKYLLTIVDEFSRFPFAFPCNNMKAGTVIVCLEQLFSIFGMPNYIHSDRGTDFLSHELKTYLGSRGIASSRTSRYNPRGNGQVEKYNGTIWRAINLALKTKDMDVRNWECVIPEALHSIRSLLCVSTNCTPHERLFSFQRKATSGNTVPAWLTNPGPVLVKKHVQGSKYCPTVEKADLIEANPEYAFVRLENGHEATVSLRDLAPCQTTSDNSECLVSKSPHTDIPVYSERDLATLDNANVAEDTNAVNINEKVIDVKIESDEARNDPELDKPAICCVLLFSNIICHFF